MERYGFLYLVEVLSVCNAVLTCGYEHLVQRCGRKNDRPGI